LSFFLTGRAPDEELLAAAEKKTLSTPAVLDAQVRRLLADPHSQSLVESFAFQWLKLRALEDIDPDPIIFPNFDDSLRTAFRREIELFVGSVLHEDRSVLELLTADHTFVNERLALHYGIPNIRGDRFRRVTLADQNRWGLLGKGAVLLSTSYANRTRRCCAARGSSRTCSARRRRRRRPTSKRSRRTRTARRRGRSARSWNSIARSRRATPATA
jgi:hypothetical protein